MVDAGELIVAGIGLSIITTVHTRSFRAFSPRRAYQASSTLRYMPEVTTNFLLREMHS